MRRPLRFLMIEDSEDDHLIVRRVLEQSGFDVSSRRVDAEAEMRDALASESWDAVIADYHVPGFGAASAFSVLKDSNLDLPFIVVSGKIGEEAAVSCLREGAHDFVLKDRLTRLPTAIEREIQAARDRAERRAAARRSSALALERDEARDRLRMVIDATPHAVLMVDAAGRITRVNRGAELAFGYERDELLGRTVDLLVPDRIWTQYSLDAARHAEAPRALTLGAERNLYGLRRDGSEFPVELDLVPFDTGSGRFALISVVDVTERKRAESVLKENEERFRQIAENIDEVFWITDVRAMKLIYVSPAYEAIWGRSCSALHEKPTDWWKTIHPEDRARIVEEAAAKRVRGGFDESYRIVRPDGAVRWIRARTFPIRDEKGGISRVVGIASDLTDYRQLEHELLHAQKLESVGRLAAGVAHEINTPTQFVGDNVRFLGDAIADLEKLATAALALSACANEEALEIALKNLEAVKAEVDLEYLRGEYPIALEQALDGIERIARIVSAMRDFAHVDSAEATAVDVNRVIRNAITVCRNEWKYVADLEERLDESSPMVMGFAQDLGQVVMNLVVNAAHAIGEENDAWGKITVRSYADETTVTVEVEDDGTGIPDAIKPRVFEQFFTTKTIGKGTGQGLALCRGIIANKHGGSINFESTPGEGTVFRVVLPRATPAP